MEIKKVMVIVSFPTHNVDPGFLWSPPWNTQCPACNDGWWVPARRRRYGQHEQSP